jgi:acyl-CoA synthetase (AMP-forming)/AMP-acid ligase II
VVGAPDERWGEALIAHLTPASTLLLTDDQSSTDDQLPTDDELRAWCRETLSRYKCPKRFVWHSALPRDPLGKLRRHLLKDTSRPSHPAQPAPHEEPPL